MLTYKPLKTDFIAKGFQFNQLHREGDIAIFHKVAVPTAIHPKPFDAGFEIVVVSRHNGYEIAGNKFEPAEVYPGSEQWGSMGWTEKDLYRAEIRFGKLLKGEIDPEPVIIEAPTPNEPKQPRKHRQPRSEQALVIPDGEFSTKEFAASNNIDYPFAHIFIKEQLAKGSVILSGKRSHGKGKPTNLYKKA